ncbi:MAG: hypothetical protein J7M21_02610, partial [Planctomycetes bacterium]|nr:hypothetical protein [Planctomycetota bacterium]
MGKERQPSDAAAEGDSPRPDRREGDWVRSSGPAGAPPGLAEDFAACFSAAASALLGVELRVRLLGVSTSSHAAFQGTIEQPSCCYVLSSAGGSEERSPDATQSPDAGESDEGADEPGGEPGGAVTFCLEFSPALAQALAECLMGARSCSPPEDRPLGEVERRVLLH